MAADINCVVRNCTSCAQNNPKYRQMHHMHLLSESGSFQFVAMDIDRPFLKIGHGSQYIFVTTDRYSKLTRAFPTLTTTAAHDANVFINHWLIPYSTLAYHLTDYRTQFVSKFFATVCSLFGVKHFTTMACHPQKNDQVFWFDKAIFSDLRHYVVEPQ